ncbi:hypothetical protein GCM10027036_03470 [Flavihumibacter cheonanensis]|uniref:hypothetical protein n=1 Tax=Flavihumibacter TaxID=1004301 RepID=UPI001EF91D69|nr:MULTISPECIES: hypothetical protein [Flavihumibacter]MCG7752209.1 hypothetical protein [Flavihumibacter cheonanensis]
MDNTPLQMPVRIAGLIIGYLNNALTEIEADELDNWILEKDENMELFEVLTEYERNIDFTPESYLDKYDELMELWVVSGWLVKRELNAISKYELEQLVNWLLVNPEHIHVLQQLKPNANKLRLTYYALQAHKN